MSKRTSLPVRTGRLSRMSLLGSLAAGMAGGVVSEGVRRWQRGERWDWQQQAFTPGNLTRLSDGLSKMRGAAMKMGQLLSMDAGHLLPPELAHILAGLRNDAHAMPCHCRSLNPYSPKRGGRTGHSTLSTSVISPSLQLQSVKCMRPPLRRVCIWR